MTQSEMILDHLKKGLYITPLEALEKFGCFRLGARILDLRREGYDIKTKMITVNKKIFAQYYLEPVKSLF